ncbi:tRNA (adenosine(37)-N6)-dimethylallyltransferase MiaA [Algihabitans albus]|uniref:tRNA (adenosine(37)-N6)-dimethylallyltransferase MiaA n=1 Tax=Algihabitans albus TaxID=2164067 RepID=UPI000E5C5E45|nr:tRNA (adenosine(37)-N6)-dimethylallyltransferase MiaA [Algihabitans albus]
MTKTDAPSSPPALSPDPPPAVIVAGPTASGKSALAAALAARLPGTVINADSMQIYRDLPVLSAQPDAPATGGDVPHRLYGRLDAAERCSAGRWRALALAEMEAARGEGRVPLLCGGTGLYLKALTEGIAALPPIPAELRERAVRRLAALGPAGLHAELLGRDPTTAAKLHPNDRQRLQRAWEVLEATGRGLADWQAAPNAAGPAPWRFLWLVLLPPRAALAAACDTRFEAMVAAGAVEEVRRLLARGLDPRLPAMKALGVSELADHLSGKVTLEEAVAAAQQATRRYAKRQATWLRTQVLRHIKNAYVMETQFSEYQLPETFSKVDEFLLTTRTPKDRVLDLD